MAGSGEGLTKYHHQLKKYLLLAATLVATVTYVAGLNLPGGSWLEDSPGGQLASDSILRETNFRRYIVFYYFNAISFAASILLSLLVLFLQKDGSNNFLLLIMTVMVVDLLGLMGAYAAGSSHDTFNTVCASVMAAVVSLYAAVFYVSAVARHPPELRHFCTPGPPAEEEGEESAPGAGGPSILPPPPLPATATATTPAGLHGTDQASGEGDDKKPGKKHEILLVLAIFAATVTYVAGLNPPGGFWRQEGRGAVGHPVLQGSHPNRYKAFFFCNTTAFATSLLAIMLAVDYEKLDLDGSINRSAVALYGLIITALLGLGGAYAAGSCRDKRHSAYVLLLLLLVAAWISLQQALVLLRRRNPCIGSTQEEPQGCCTSLIKSFKDSKFVRSLIKSYKDSKFDRYIHKVTTDVMSADLKRTKEYIQLLATLAATIAYQAGLDPPGGVWASNGEGHNVGDPILLTTHPGRFKVFFYFNSAAFVASIVIVIMLQSERLVRGHALEVAMILDFFGLIGAYAAGSCRDTNTSIYTVALAGGVLIYVVIHIVFLTLDQSDHDEMKEKYEKHRELLLLLAILAATLTYQAGLTPPGGFWEDDDKFGHRAGFPVLLDKYHRRYKAFYYCNAASFMSSVALIILLLNPNLYRPGIRCYALVVCMVAGMIGVLGAYAAGSSLHLRTSIVFLVLVAVGFAIVICLAIIRHRHQGNKNHDNESPPEQEEDMIQMQMYLMLVGILAASVTYQTGLKPPGGMWRDDSNGHSAGNPVLYDINKRRYNVFFYSNSTSFVASIVVIALLLLRMMLPDMCKLPLGPMRAAMLLDMLALLVAYAAGSNRESHRSWKVIMLLPIVVVFVFSFVFVYKNNTTTNEGFPPPDGQTSSAHTSTAGAAPA
ncbi:unnamed protein product [Urochloa decumbens]|uniref:PGG domain-containing protein n=1 Tax=Urochloa decumbens TaxID=240449 RepID=A0ABC9AI52_9POAL